MGSSTASFYCTCCLERHPGKPPKTIDIYAICRPCITDMIIPLFEQALKYEAAYPPTFGSGIRLNPADFLSYFDDWADFLPRWEERVNEYETPYKARIYCGCGDFLGIKEEHEGMTGCGCGAVMCWACGEDVTDTAQAHVCGAASEGEDEDVCEGLERGRDYQICPNLECGARVSLMSGCNHMVCPSASCETEFCFICGDDVGDGERSGHWTAGKPCPRYDHPDAANAIYDRNDPIAQLRAVFGDPDGMLGRAMGHDEHEDEDDADAVDFPTFTGDLLFESLGPQEYDRRIQDVVSLMNDLPALPANLQDLTQQQQLQAEQDLSPDLLASPLGQRMLRHQQEVAVMIERVEATLADAEGDARPPPPWAPPALDMMNALVENLDLYVYRVRLRTQYDVFEDRHDDLAAAWGPHQRAIFARFRDFYEILATYTVVAEIRMLAVEEVRDGIAPTGAEAERGIVEARGRDARTRRVRELGVASDDRAGFDRVVAAEFGDDAVVREMAGLEWHAFERVMADVAREERRRRGEDEARELERIRRDVAVLREQFEAEMAQVRGHAERAQQVEEEDPDEEL